MYIIHTYIHTHVYMYVYIYIYIYIYDIYIKTVFSWQSVFLGGCVFFQWLCVETAPVAV